MPKMLARKGAVVATIFGVLAVSVATITGAATLEQETAATIETIRAIRTGQNAAVIATYNQQMDAAWKFYGSHKPEILPILGAQLKAEIGREHPSDLVLLDVGLFLHESGDADGKKLAREALFRLNPGDPVVNENWKELFELVHGAAEDHDARVLDLIDRSFLSSDQKIFIPQHALQLDGTLICVFLYGAYGPDAETHLAAQLQSSGYAKRILEVLVWLGSPDSLPRVGDALSASPTYETFSRLTAFMMQVAGPAGREYMLKLDPKNLDPQSREYLAKIHPAIQRVSFDSIRDPLSKFPGDKVLSADEVKVRLNSMIANDGKDDRTSPVAFLDSEVSSDFLVTSLLKVRSLMLYRLSDEALSDVQTTNALINGLRYRGH